MQATTLDDYVFPIEERIIEVPKRIVGKDENYGIMPVNDTSRYKAIVRSDTGNLISVVSDGYQVVTNENLIQAFVEQLDGLKEPWEMDPSHSWVKDNRMRLQVKFPGIAIPDGDTYIALSIFLHNSYDRTEGIRAIWGGIRNICTNGMVFGRMLGRFYGRHVKGFNMDRMKKAFDKTLESLPMIQNRIEELKNIKVSQEFIEKLQKEIGKRAIEAIFGIEDVNIEDLAPNETLWGVYNKATEHISHRVSMVQQERYQESVSKIFAL